MSLTPKSLGYLDTLHPDAIPIFQACLDLWHNHGFNVQITSGSRTFAEQDKLYAQGRSVHGAKVTNATGGQSAHNYGVAIDVVVLVDGVCDWNFDTYHKLWSLVQEHLPTIISNNEFFWAGLWTSFREAVHFDLSGGKNFEYLKSKYPMYRGLSI